MGTPAGACAKDRRETNRERNSRGSGDSGREKLGSRLAARNSYGSDRYESCIAKQPTTKSRHVRHGAWKTLGKGGRVAYQRAPVVARIVDHTGAAAYPSHRRVRRRRRHLLRVLQEGCGEDPRVRERKDSLVCSIPRSRWRLILKPLYVLYERSVLHRRPHRFT